MKNILLILTATFSLFFSVYSLSQCSSCMPSEPVGCSSCQITSSSACNMPRASCQCTDPYCFSSERTCMSLSSCCEAFGNVGELNDEGYEVDPYPYS